MLGAQTEGPGSTGVSSLSSASQGLRLVEREEFLVAFASGKVPNGGLTLDLSLYPGELVALTVTQSPLQGVLLPEIRVLALELELPFSDGPKERPAYTDSYVQARREALELLHRVNPDYPMPSDEALKWDKPPYPITEDELGAFAETYVRELRWEVSSGRWRPVSVVFPKSIKPIYDPDRGEVIAFEGISPNGQYLLRMDVPFSDKNIDTELPETEDEIDALLEGLYTEEGTREFLGLLRALREALR